MLRQLCSPQLASSIWTYTSVGINCHRSSGYRPLPKGHANPSLQHNLVQIICRYNNTPRETLYYQSDEQNAEWLLSQYSDLGAVRLPSITVGCTPYTTFRAKTRPLLCIMMIHTHESSDVIYHLITHIILQFCLMTSVHCPPSAIYTDEEWVSRKAF